MIGRRRMTRCAATIVSLLAAGALHAQTPPRLTPEQQRTEQQAAFQAADKVATRGAAAIALRDQAKLDLPQGYAFVPQPEAGRVMRALGNSDAPTLIGLVFPESNANWFATVRFIAEGYIKDDDAKNWNADELLQTLKDGTEAGNSDRIARGFDALEVTRWIERPIYEGGNHRLVWSALVRTKGSTDDTGAANYNTYALGRDGYFSLNLITAVAEVEGNKKYARELLASLNYVDGKRYADFNESTDPVAAYGLAALVGGAAAKKLGLFAVIAAFVLKAWKLLFIGGVAILAGAVKLFGRRKSA